MVEAADEDKAALSKAQVIFTGLGRVTAEHIAAAPALELIQCASHGFDYVDLAAARRRGIVVCNIGSSEAEAAGRGRADLCAHARSRQAADRPGTSP